MAIVETLEIRFQANLGRLSRQLAAAANQLEKLGDAAEAVQEDFHAAVSGCAAAGRGIANTLAGEMRAGRGQTVSAGRELANAASEGLRSAVSASSAPGSAGRLLAGRFCSAVLSGSSQAASAAGSVAAAADFSSGNDAAYSAGANLSQGFANGILSRMGAVIAAANRVAAAATSRIQSALKIHSPSKVAFELGGNFGDGFAGGVLASVKAVERSAQAVSLAAASVAPVQAAAGREGGGIESMVRAAVQESLGGTNIVVPLHVDGVKLGEASIRGINRVTRSAGRLMLEI